MKVAVVDWVQWIVGVGKEGFIDVESDGSKATEHSGVTSTRSSQDDPVHDFPTVPKIEGLEVRRLP